MSSSSARCSRADRLQRGQRPQRDRTGGVEPVPRADRAVLEADPQIPPQLTPSQPDEGSGGFALEQVSIFSFALKALL